MRALRAALRFDDDDECWTGPWPWQNSTIELFVAGAPDAPDKRLLDALERWLHQTAELETAAIAYLTPEDQTAHPFILDGLQFLWPKTPTKFVVTLHLEDDEDAIWRVEFDDGRAVGSGRDD